MEVITIIVVFGIGVALGMYVSSQIENNIKRK
jgi:uncharacterized protein YneF (UPF0154 family)